VAGFVTGFGLNVVVVGDFCPLQLSSANGHKSCFDTPDRPFRFQPEVSIIRRVNERPVLTTNTRDANDWKVSESRHST
jgi:hypothetical protein